MPGTRESLGHFFYPARRTAAQICSRKQYVPGTSRMRSEDAVRHALHCRAGKIVAQGHPFAVPAMARYRFRIGAFCESCCRSLQNVQKLSGRFLQNVQSPQRACKKCSLRISGKYVVKHIKTCCTTYKYSCKLRKKAVPLH